MWLFHFIFSFMYMPKNFVSELYGIEWPYSIKCDLPVNNHSCYECVRKNVVVITFYIPIRALQENNAVTVMVELSTRLIHRDWRSLISPIAARWTQNGNFWRFVVLPLSLFIFFRFPYSLYFANPSKHPLLHTHVLKYNSYVEPLLRGI